MAAVLPDVLEDIRHLQALREGHRQALQPGAMPRDRRRIFAKQLREHVADHAGDVVAIIVQIGAAAAARAGSPWTGIAACRST